MQYMRNMMVLGSIVCLCWLVPSAGQSAETIAYSYDAMGRLTQADLGQGAQFEYAYDKMGNRLSQTIRAGEAPNQPPNLPFNPSIADGAAGVPQAPLLSWSGGDPDPDDTVLYEVYFGGGADELLLISTQHETAFLPGRLDPLSTYFWQIVAYDDSGAMAEGSLWSFTTGEQDNSVPEAGTLLLLVGGLLGLTAIWRRRKKS